MIFKLIWKQKFNKWNKNIKMKSKNSGMKLKNLSQKKQQKKLLTKLQTFTKWKLKDKKNKYNRRIESDYFIDSKL